MTTTTLSVPDISCGHCKATIEGAVGGLEGIGGVTVDIEPRLVRLSFDEEQVSIDAIVAAIEEAGYSVAH
jgi:copper chaperone